MYDLRWTWVDFGPQMAIPHRLSMDVIGERLIPQDRGRQVKDIGRYNNTY